MNRFPSPVEPWHVNPQSPWISNKKRSTAVLNWCATKRRYRVKYSNWRLGSQPVGRKERYNGVSPSPHNAGPYISRFAFPRQQKPMDHPWGQQVGWLYCFDSGSHSTRFPFLPSDRWSGIPRAVAFFSALAASVLKHKNPHINLLACLI